MTKKPAKSALITITQFSKKGHGLGYRQTSDLNQKEVEVPFTIPGDIAHVTLYQKRKGPDASQLKELVQKSPDRISARCIHFGECGGCRLQHIDYSKQLAVKQELVVNLFKPLMEQATVLYPIIPCDLPWYYRNKMEFSFSNDASGKKFLGLIINSSRGKVLNLKECHLCEPWFMTCLQAVRNWWEQSLLSAYHPYSNQGALRTLTLRQGKRTQDRLIILTVSGNPEFALNKDQLTHFVSSIKEAMGSILEAGRLSIFLCIQQAIKGTPTNFYEMHLHGPDHMREILHVQPVANEPHLSLEFSISASAFFQPNTFQAETLYSRALQLLEISSHNVVYDLYCGTGTLGICAAKKAKSVIGIELSPEAVLDAKANVKRNQLTNIEIRQGSVADVVSALLIDESLKRPDIIMVDPPRIGLDAKTLEHLSILKPQKLLYISCNPTTQADNIKVLQSIGYELKVLQPVDQFPHTMHIENIAILTLK